MERFFTGSWKVRVGGSIFGQVLAIPTFTAAPNCLANSRLIDQAATALANAIAGDLRELLERLLQHRLDGTNPPLPVPPLGAAEKIKLLKLIIASAGKIR